MQSLTIALLQIFPGSSIEENRIIGIEACKTAKTMGADIALFPEIWTSGYSIPQGQSALEAEAISRDGEFLKSFSQLARELNMAIAITYLENREGAFRNSLSLYDRHGEEALYYAKVHTCAFDEEKVLEPGDDFFVTELDTEGGRAKIGAMICFDREFPESARILMLKGAEIVLVPNACPMEINRISQLRGRAYENMMGIATANYPKGHPDCNGHSNAFDGIAYRPGEACSRDTLLIEAGEAPGIYLGRFNMDELRQYRKEEVHGNAYRRPEKYGLLVARK